MVDTADNDALGCLDGAELLESLAPNGVPSMGLVENTVDEGFSPISDGTNCVDDTKNSLEALSTPFS